MQHATELTLVQTVFTVFYAIFWGVVANAQPKWKAFNWGAAFQTGCGRIRRRGLLAVVMLNIFPIALYVVVIYRLHFAPVFDWDVLGTKQLILAIIAAMSPFGVNRLWISILEFSPSSYYFEAQQRNDLGLKDLNEPSREDLGLQRRFALSNLVVGLAYLLLAFLAAQFV